MTRDILVKESHLVLEGGVGAGKSSACALLESEHGFFHLKEYMSFTINRTGASLSSLPPKERFRYFLKVERTRIEKLREHSGGRPCAIDRCFLSILAFEFAQRILGKLSVSVDEIRSIFLEDTLLLLVPEKIVFIDIGDETRAHRVAQRKNVVRGDLVLPLFNDAVRSFFNCIRTCVDVRWISADMMTVEDLVRHCLSVHAALHFEKSGTITSEIPDIFLEIYRHA